MLEEANGLMNNLGPSLLTSNDKVPLEVHEFSLQKPFVHALALRYGWTPFIQLCLWIHIHSRARFVLSTKGVLMIRHNKICYHGVLQVEPE